MIQRVAIAIVLIILLGGFSVPINGFIKNLRTDPVVIVDEITTGVGETTGEIVLARELFAYNLVNVTDVTSSDVGDSPIASDYDDATMTLTISGLLASTTRDVTVDYLAPMEDDFWSALGPFLGFLVYGGILAAIVYMVWSGRHR
jgi:hypothetical protein